jgi:amino acid transporter
VHPRFATPHVAIATYAALIIALALTGKFEGLMVLASIASLTIYLLCSMAAAVLERRDVRDDGEPFRAPGGALVPVLACVGVAWLCWETITRAEFSALVMVILAAVVFYVVRARRVSRVAR